MSSRGGLGLCGAGEHGCGRAGMPSEGNKRKRGQRGANI
jgi:hypothetical protein